MTIFYIVVLAGAVVGALGVGMLIGGLNRAAALPTPPQEVAREGTIYKRGDVVIFETDRELSADVAAMIREQTERELEPLGVKVVLLSGGIHSSRFLGAIPCSICGKDLARSRSEETDSLRYLTLNGRRVASVTLYGDLSGEFTLSEADASS